MAKVKSNDTEKVVDNKKDNRTIEAIVKEFGEVFYSGERVEASSGVLIPLTLSLDIALSGGIKEGTITIFATLPKVGKTTVMLEFVKNAQRIFKKRCFYFDVEARLQPDLLKTINDLVYTSEQEQATGIPAMQIIRSSEGNILTAEKFLEIADRLIKDVPGCVIIIDSVAALCTEDAFTKSLTDNAKMADVQKLMYFFFRKISQILPITKACIVGITHLQANPGSYSGAPKKYGGAALEYFASNRLESYSGGKEVPETGTPKIGKNTNVKITASAVGGPSNEGMIYIKYGHGHDNIADLVDNADRYGYITRKGAWYSFKSSAGEDIQLQGKESVEEYFRVNKKEFVELTNIIRKALIPNAILLPSPS